MSDHTDASLPIHRIRDALRRGEDIVTPTAGYDNNAGASKPCGSLMPKGALNYVPPCSGGWGIIRGALQVPESITIFQTPVGCGRHGSVAAIMDGNRDRMYFIDIHEDDLVMGRHMDSLEHKVDAIMRLREEKPKAVWIFSTCIDDLLGSDYEGVCNALSDRYGIPFVNGRMDPVTSSSSTPPMVKYQRSVVRFLSEAGPVPVRDDVVAIMGNFAPVEANSELYELLRSAGVASVRSLPDCATFEDLLAMREASRVIAVTAWAQHGCRDLKRAFGTPWRYCGLHYDPAAIARTYEDMGDFLGRTLPWEPYYEQALASIDQARSWACGLRVAVGAGLNGSTFEIATVLARAGAKISFLIAGEVSEHDLPYLEELTALNPNIPVYPESAPAMALVTGVPHATDVAVGYGAAWLAPESSVFSLGENMQPYGFQATNRLLDGVRSSIGISTDVRQLFNSEALVI